MSMTEDQTIAKAIEILESRFDRGISFTQPANVGAYLRLKLAERKAEAFAVLFLDNGHRLIEYRELFQGTIDGASVYPREVVRAVIEVNASAVIFAHNHPSGQIEPSKEDIRITEHLTRALALIDVRVLDHMVVGYEGYTSMAERGLI